MGYDNCSFQSHTFTSKINIQSTLYVDILKMFFLLIQLKDLFTYLEDAKRVHVHKAVFGFHQEKQTLSPCSFLTTEIIKNLLCNY